MIQLKLVPLVPFPELHGAVVGCCPPVCPPTVVCPPVKNKKILIFI